MDAWRSPKLLSWLVLAAGGALALAAGLWQKRVNDEVVSGRFERLVVQTAEQVQDRLQLYEYGLRAARGAVIAAGGEAITRESFQRYARSRDIQSEFPGARGFGFVRRVSVEQEAAFLARARADGWPDFTIRQLAPHQGERYVIQYVEPVELNQEAIGLDIASETNRREAAELASRTGEPTLTGPITLVQASGKKQRSFLLLLAVYGGVETPLTVAERRNEVFGWAYTPLVTDEVLQDFDYADGQFTLALYDRAPGGVPERFFSSLGWSPAPPGALVKEVGASVFGRIWTVQVQALPPFFLGLNLRNPLALTGTVAATALLLAVLTHVYQLGAGRARVAGLQRARMAAIVENSTDAIVGQTLDGTVREWNPAAQRMFGYTVAEAVGRTVRHLIVPDDRADEETAMLERVGRGQSVAGFDTVRRRRDGRMLDVSVSVAPIRLDSGEIIGVAKTLRDISDRKSAEAEILQLNATLEQQVAQRTAELRQMAARERAILTSAGSAIIAVDNDGIVTMFNPAAEAMLGCRADEVVGKVSALVFHDPEELRQRGEVLARKLGRPVDAAELMTGPARDGDIVRSEWTYVRRDGTRLPVLLTLSALREGSGETLGFIGVATDLSDRARLQQELLDVNRALTERSAQAEAATRAKSEFLANMSHEIRTPMNAIVGLTEMMRRDVKDPVLRDRLDKMSDASRHLLAIINNVLDLSKIEAGRLVLEQVEFELSDVLENTCALVIEDARRKGLEVVIDIDDVPRRLVGDPIRLGQALLNLLSNAVKFTPAGFVVLRCLLADGTQGEQMLRFEVTDSGVGISPAVIDKLFRPFEQADTSTTRRYGGSGLGLAITRQLADLMGGHAGARSREGRGSTFWFTARFAPAPRVDEPSSTGVAVRCLMLDDLPATAQAVASMLERLGVQADQATRLDEAAHLLLQAQRRGRPYELLVWDADLAPLPPALRKLQHDQPAVVFTTIRNADAWRPALRGLSRAQVLEKPLTLRVLENAIRALQAKRSGPDGQAAADDEADDHGARRPFEHRRVLVAEDNPVNQMVAVDQLRSLGLEVDVAENGAKALDCARRQRYDLILMDLHMPEMDGLEATRAIRRLPSHASTPILAMTASAFGEDRSASLAAGMDDHISKPVETQVLVRTLERWLHPPPQRPGRIASRRSPR
ncbi:CHASE domain-containing protein [Schlegelella sp. S2-27]|uniref:histidine kinase n=1 Tax=Caldimonas mangrovi TaxID=2944811 RepID=A0ABT0YPK3_9BURK|nr:CHASE domain-containing protein [Caldimonas mangrovi]MCM5680665.1 CHASE domain-containing protein [Caldimonas mangrovi]